MRCVSPPDKRGRGAIEREIAEADASQEGEPRRGSRSAGRCAMAVSRPPASAIRANAARSVDGERGEFARSIVRGTSPPARSAFSRCPSQAAQRWASAAARPCQADSSPLCSASNSGSESRCRNSSRTSPRAVVGEEARIGLREARRRSSGRRVATRTTSVPLPPSRFDHARRPCRDRAPATMQLAQPRLVRTRLTVTSSRAAARCHAPCSARASATCAVGSSLPSTRSSP